jgi:hypothetical protein
METFLKRTLIGSVIPHTNVINEITFVPGKYTVIVEIGACD